MSSRLARTVVVLLGLGVGVVACGRDFDALFEQPPATGNGGDAGDTPSDAAAPFDGGSSSGSTTQCTNTAPKVVPSCGEGSLGRSIHTDPGDARLITLPADDDDDRYDPNCMTIKVGQSVTWRGKLSEHPLIPREDSTLPNPINPVSSGNEWVVKFDCPGDYNFSCRTHKDDMLGTIRVLP